jgi:hypothetical protein
VPTSEGSLPKVISLDDFEKYRDKLDKLEGVTFTITEKTRDSDIQAMAEVVKALPNLKTLNLTVQQGAGEWVPDLTLLFQALRDSSVKHLDITGSDFGDKKPSMCELALGQSLAKGLDGNNSLQIVVLDGFSADFARPLLRLLATNKCGIRELGIGPTGQNASDVSAMLCSNTTLSRLGLNLDPTSLKKLLRGLLKNRSLGQLEIGLTDDLRSTPRMTKFIVELHKNYTLTDLLVEPITPKLSKVIAELIRRNQDLRRKAAEAILPSAAGEAFLHCEQTPLPREIGYLIGQHLGSDGMGIAKVNDETHKTAVNAFKAHKRAEAKPHKDVGQLLGAAVRGLGKRAKAGDARERTKGVDEDDNSKGPPKT